MTRRQISSGPRFVQIDDFKGQEVEVVVGYDAVGDRWVTHVWVGRGPAKQKVGDAVDFGVGTEAEALDAGFGLGRNVIDGIPWTNGKSTVQTP